MSRFCTNCGTKGDEGAKICTNCGTPFEDVPVPANQQNISNKNQNVMPNNGGMPQQSSPMPNYGGMPQQSSPMPNYGGMPQQSSPMPNYGGMPQQSSSMPNYGGMPQPTSISNSGNISEQKNTINMAAMSQSEKKQGSSFNISTPVSASNNAYMPAQNSMPSNGSMPLQGSMPNNGVVSPQTSMPNNGVHIPNGVTPGFGANTMSGNVVATKGNNRKAIAVVCIASGIVLVLIIVAIVIFANFSGSGYESVIEQKLTAVEELNSEKLARTYPLFLYEDDYDTFEEFVDDVDKDAMEGVEYAMDILEDEVGENIRLSYEIEKVGDVSDKKFENFCEGIEKAHDYDISKIKEIKRADIIVTVKGDDDTYEFNWEDVYLIKDNGEWYILNLDFEFGNLNGSGSIMHYDYYDYYNAEDNFYID